MLFLKRSRRNWHQGVGAALPPRSCRSLSHTLGDPSTDPGRVGQRARRPRLTCAHRSVADPPTGACSDPAGPGAGGGGAHPVTVAAGTTTAAPCPGPRPGFATAQPSGHPGPGPALWLPYELPGSISQRRPQRPLAAGGPHPVPGSHTPPYTRSRPVRQKPYPLPTNPAQPNSSPRLCSHFRSHWSAPQNTKEAINEVT